MHQSLKNFKASLNFVVMRMSSKWNSHHMELSSNTICFNDRMLEERAHEELLNVIKPRYISYELLLAILL